MKAGDFSLMHDRVIGFVGLGEMGQPMASSILGAGFSLIAYDKRRECLDKIRKQGAKVCPSSIELARSADIIITMLPDSEAVRQVLIGEKGLLQALGNRHTIIEMSTIDVGTTLEIAREIESRNASFLDAPVGGTPEMAERREAEILASGQRESVENCMDVLGAMSKHVVYVGKTGAGKTLKLATNLLIALNKLALTEAVCFALSNGIDQNVILEVIRNSNANSVAFERYGRAVMEETNERIARKHSWQLKDLGLVIKKAEESSISLPLGKLSELITRNASEQSGGAEDFQSIVKYYKKLMKIGPSEA